MIIPEAARITRGSVRTEVLQAVCAEVTDRRPVTRASASLAYSQAEAERSHAVAEFHHHGNASLMMNPQ
jgi:hypothetical protein